MENPIPRTVEISIRISSEDDLYNRFDPTRTLLSDDVMSYILSETSNLRVGCSARLNIISPGPVDEDGIRKAFVKSTEGRISEIG